MPFTDCWMNGPKTGDVSALPGSQIPRRLRQCGSAGDAVGPGPCRRAEAADYLEQFPLDDRILSWVPAPYLNHQPTLLIEKRSDGQQAHN
jgi:hypothetical protein